MKPAFSLFSFAAATALVLTGCVPADEADGPVDAPVRSEADARALITKAEKSAEVQAQDCLLMVWSNQNQRDIEFDRAHDLVDGGAISCATGTSASRFDAALSALRDAARAGDRARVFEQVGLPLLYIDRAGNRIELKTEEEVEAVYDEIFTTRLVDMLDDVELEEMTVVPERGGFFRLGALWLVVEKNGGDPRLVTVNQQALEEAAEAARRKARNREGKAVSAG